MHFLKKQLVFILLLFTTTSLFSSELVPAKVFIYRESNYQGGVMPYNVFDKDSMIIRLKNNSYFVYSCLPGLHGFRMNDYRQTTLHINVEAGKNYYLRMGMRMGMWSGIPELILVDSISGIPAVRDGRMTQLFDNRPSIRTKSRIGLNMNLGFGFQNTNMIKLESGDESSISFGGGYAIGLKYGYELNKLLDLSFDFNYHESELRPLVSDANIKFGRTALSITPAYIYPLNRGDAMRLKVGGGLDYYFGNIFTFDTSKMTDGISDTWKYNNALGYHLSVVWEMNPSDEWSFNYGFKWYSVEYDFNSGNRYLPKNDTFNHPSGSGIDFTCGFNYHF
jgi:hypothetical protein